MMNEEIKLCECGCGEIVKPGNRFINGHQHRTEKYWNEQKEPQLCECGCAQLVKPGKRFIHGHNGKLNPPTNDSKIRDKISKANIERFKDPLECQKQSERMIKYFTHFINREKMSEKIMKFYEENPVSNETREKLSKAQTKRWLNQLERQRQSERMIGYHKENPISDITRQRRSAGRQGISYDEWEEFAKGKEYCPKFDELCRESNRKKYNYKCFLCNKNEKENTCDTGRNQKLSVHHVDMNKDQGCNGHEWKLVPLCMKCHGMVHSELWEVRIEYILKYIGDNK